MQLKAGDWIKTNRDDWHIIVRVDGEGFIQSTTGWSVQSDNRGKATSRITIFDGRFLQTRDIDEVDRMYKELFSPKYDNKTKERFLFSHYNVI